jgi:hypothetical protein
MPADGLTTPNKTKKRPPFPAGAEIEAILNAPA